MRLGIGEASLFISRWQLIHVDSRKYFHRLPFVHTNANCVPKAMPINGWVLLIFQITENTLSLSLSHSLRVQQSEIYIYISNKFWILNFFILNLCQF